MISRLFNYLSAVIFISLLPLNAFADPAQSARIGDAYYQYCIQESLANDTYCSCIADSYAENLAAVDLTAEEEKFIIQALGGQFSYNTLSTHEIALTEQLMDRLNSPALEDGFMACASLNEEIFIEGEVENDTNAPLTEERLRAIEELEAIEEMEEREYIEDTKNR